jgi:sarcosine oxidase
VKIASFRNGVPSDPDHLDRQIHPDEIARISSYVVRRFVGGAALHVHDHSCAATRIRHDDHLNVIAERARTIHTRRDRLSKACAV